jgi:2',3'-cyclic-nucleotide 2'-phosphodiesterase (5'-nucleotidase family)
MKQLLTILLVVALLASCGEQPPLIISFIGSNDVHGQMLPKENPTEPQHDLAGLALFSAYVAAIRDVRANDGGAVLLIDAGDMWQGTLESNLSEGASMIAAFNALGYTAAALGNHEFDFGPAGPAPIPESDTDDARGALKARAREAAFPILAANLIDDASGKPVEWGNISPSVVIDVKGVKIGIIGILSETGLDAAIAANTKGLSLAPLAATIEKEARAVRDAGATIVIVTAHAGGGCGKFDDPYDTSSCDLSHEIFQVANALPAAYVDHIFAGHAHMGIAHVVNGISITSSFSRTAAFGRVDMTIDRSKGSVVNKKIFPPVPLLNEPRYEGVDLSPSATVVAIVDQAVSSASHARRETIGITLQTPFDLEGNPESSLGNLFVDSLLDTIDADISMHINTGGIRSGLPAGDLTFGSVYEMMPFDNTLVIIELSGAELRQVISEQARRGSRRVGFSGMRVEISCSGPTMLASIHLSDGRTIEDGDTIRIALANFVAMGGDRVLASVMPADGYATQDDAPQVRDVIIRSLRQRGGSISAPDFLSGDEPRWNMPDAKNSLCLAN